MTHMPRGYIIISRCLLDNKHVGLKSGNTAYWLDLLSRAAAVDGYKGLKRGELRATFRTLAEDWGVSVKFVRCFLSKLQDQDMLQKGAQNNDKKGTSRGRAATVYSIVNYDKYQDAPAERAQVGAQKTAKKGSPEIQKLNTDKNIDLTVFVPPGPQIDLEEAIQTREKSDAQKAVDLWNDLAKREGLPQVKVLTDARRKSINARIKEAGGLEGFKQVIDYIGKTPVLIGKQKFSDGRTWKADFEYLVQPSAFVRNLEKAQAEKASRPVEREATYPSFDEIDWTQ